MAQQNRYNVPSYGNMASLNRLSAMGAQAGSPYFQFTGRPNIDQNDVMTALNDKFGAFSGGSGGGFFPGLSGRSAAASGPSAVNDPSSIWYQDPTGYGAYTAAQKRIATGGNDPTMDPSSPWYNDPNGYATYRKSQESILTQGGRNPWEDPTSQWYGNEAGYRAQQAAGSSASSVTSAENQARLDQFAHPGMVLYHGQWVYPYSTNPTSGGGTGTGQGR